MSQPSHVLPDQSRQRQVWFGDTFTRGYIASGGAFVVPGGGGLTLATQPCEAYVYDSTSGELLYAGQPTSPIGPLNGGNGTYWIAIHRNPSSAVAGWTRQPGTRYLSKLSATLPPTPDAAELLAKVTVSGGSITAVKDYRNPSSYARYGVYDVTDPLYGAVSSPTYAVSSLVPIQSALNRSNQIHCPQGVYWLGDLAPGDVAFDLSTLGAGVSISTEGIVQMVVHTPSAGIGFVFQGANNPGFYCGPMSFLDTGFDNNITWRGAMAFRFLNLAGADDWEGIKIAGLTCQDMVAAFVVAASAPYSTTNRIRGIHFASVALNNCYYGVNCQNEGDGLTIDLLTATKTRRVYFVYGVNGHKVHLVTRRNYTSNGNVLISRVAGGLDTTGISVHYTAYEDDAVFYAPIHVHVQHGDLLGGTIAGLDLDINIEAPNGIPYQSVRFSNFVGTSETTAPSLNYTADVRLRGSCDGNAEFVTTAASYLARRQMTFETGLGFLPTQSTYDAFQMTVQERLYTACAWGATTGADPGLGNGTLSFSMDVHNGMVTLSMYMLMGSTTTFGTGEWFFWHFLLAGQYMNVKAASVGSWIALDSLSGWYTGACKCEAGSLVIDMYANNAATRVKYNTPHTWAENDRIWLTITFPISGN